VAIAPKGKSSSVDLGFRHMLKGRFRRPPSSAQSQIIRARHLILGLVKSSPTITISSPALPNGVGILRHSVFLVISTELKKLCITRQPSFTLSFHFKI
jgi:hypothetical protein